jgi:hypothetical protein
VALGLLAAVPALRLRRRGVDEFLPAFARRRRRTSERVEKPAGASGGGTRFLDVLSEGVEKPAGAPGGGTRFLDVLSEGVEKPAGAPGGGTRFLDVL